MSAPNVAIHDGRPEDTYGLPGRADPNPVIGTPDSAQRGGLSAPSAAACALCATLILGPVVYVFFPLADHDAARVTQLLLLAFALLAGLVDAARGAQSMPRSPILQWAAVLLGALAVVSISNAPLKRFAVTEAALFASLIGLGLLCSRWAGRHARQVLAVAVAASLLFSFFVLVRYAAAFSAEVDLLRDHLFPGYSNYRFHNHVQTVLIPLLVTAAVAAGLGDRVRRLALVAVTLEFCWLFFSAGRATTLALCVAGAFLAVVFGSRSRRWLLVIATSAVIGFALKVLLFEMMPVLSGLEMDFGTRDLASRVRPELGNERAMLWRLAVDYIRESPLVGIGPMHYAARINVEAAHPHNFYLQLAAEWGVPFAVLVVSLAAAGFVRVVRAARRAEDPDRMVLGLGIVAALIGVAVDAVFSGNLIMPMSQLWICILFALAVGYLLVEPESAAQTETASKPNPPVRASLAAVWGLIAFGLFQGALPEALDVQSHVDQVRREVVANVRDNPRFWSHGWIR